MFEVCLREVFLADKPIKRQAEDSIAPTQSQPYTSLCLAKSRHETHKRTIDTK